MMRAPGRFLVVLAAVALCLGIYGYLGETPAAESGRVYLTNNGGPVLFTHAAHAEQVGNCVACHHDLVVDLVASCDDCHDAGEMDPDLLDHADLQAIEAHSCDGCHEIAPAADAAGCRDCHDNAEIADRYHQQCNNCHLAQARARFAGDDQQVRCEACHLK